MVSWDPAWKQVSDKRSSVIQLERLAIIPVLKREEISIVGEDLLERSRKEEADFSQEDAKALLMRSKLLSTIWNPSTLLFPGTVYHHPSYGRAVPSLWAMVSTESRSRAEKLFRWHLSLFRIDDNNGVIQEFYKKLHFLQILAP